MKKWVLIFLLPTLVGLSADWRENYLEVGTFLTVSPTGEISPTGAVATINALAVIAAKSQANAVRADLLAEATADAEAKAEAFEAIVQAREGTIWIDSMNVPRIGERSIDSQANVTSEIVRFDPKVYEDGEYFVNRTFAFFSIDPGYVPSVRIGNNLADSNSWFQASSVASYTTNGILIGGTLYDSVFVNEFRIPKAWSNAYARVVSEVRGATTNMTLFVVRNGIKLKGEDPLSLSVDYGTNKVRIVGGIWCLPK